jgi:octaprenyl-diphosphate synthase
MPPAAKRISDRRLSRRPDTFRGVTTTLDSCRLAADNRAVRSDLVIDPDVPTKSRVGEDALTALSNLLRDDLAACERAILTRMTSSVAFIPRLAAHVVAAGGKRLRPMLTLASARLCDSAGDDAPGGDAQDRVALAACVELIHTATLLHDDVVDRSLLRRGLRSANAVFGDKAPVLVGDFLFARAFQIMVDLGSPRVLSILSGAAATMASGEVLQLSTQSDLTTSDATYLDVVKGKTAALFGAACQAGAVVAGRADAEPALAEYGVNLGIAFQLADDALDYAADETALGKTVGDDFREGKVTLPVLLAYRRGDVAERAFWERTIGRTEQTEDDLPTALALMREHRVIGGTLDRARSYAERSRDALAGFPETPIWLALRRVADFTVSRSR